MPSNGGTKEKSCGISGAKMDKSMENKDENAFQRKDKKKHIHFTIPHRIAMLLFLGDQDKLHHKFQEQISISHGWNQFIKNSDHLKLGGITNTNKNRLPATIFSRLRLEKGQMSHLRDFTFRLVYQWNQPVTSHYFLRGLDPLTW